MGINDQAQLVSRFLNHQQFRSPCRKFWANAKILQRSEQTEDSVVIGDWTFEAASVAAAG